MDKIFTCHTGNNDLLIERAAALYLKPGSVIADVTYGRGIFWKKVDLSQHEFYPSDIITCPDTPYDFRSLPYLDNVFDLVVFDPPYVSSPGKRFKMEAEYQNHATTALLRHTDIVDLYRDGMVEAQRVLKPGGMLWVKCKDEVHANKQYFTHIEIHTIAVENNYYPKDLFILHPPGNPPIPKDQVQRHARKNHSYLWVFINE